MNDLIEALTIFSKYMDKDCDPTNCDHDVLMVLCGHELIPDNKKNRLDELGFVWSDERSCWISFRFGSA